MKAISLWQPWASLMAWGEKRIETRGHPTWHRGWLAIQAAKDKRGRPALEEPEICAALERNGVTGWDGLPLGAIVCVVRVTDCQPTRNLQEQLSANERAFGNYGYGRYGWLTADLFKLPEPIECSGAQGFWFTPPDVTERIRAMGLDDAEEAAESLWREEVVS